MMITTNGLSGDRRRYKATKIIIFILYSIFVSPAWSTVPKKHHLETYKKYLYITGIEESKYYKVSLFPKDTILKSATDSIERVGYYIENSLPRGYTKNGTVDYTVYLQKAINSHTILVFPAFPLQINDEGLHIPSHRKILFLPGSQLVLKSSKKNNYKILYINNQSDVTLYNPVIIGDRFSHSGVNGEWGMGMAIYSSDHINVYNPNISNCWGDGIYISQSNNFSPSEGIVVVDANCHKNRRNGITITSGVNIVFENPIATYSDGTFPMAGIDIEPNNSNAKLENILIRNPITRYNSGKGIQIGLGKYVKNGIKPVSIEIDNHNDVGSKTAFVLSCSPGKLLKNQIDSIGYIKIINPVWSKNADSPLRANGYRTNQIRFQVVNPQVRDRGNLNMNKNTIKTMLKGSIGTGGNIDIQY